MKSEALIIGATGTVGSEVARAAVKLGARVGALVRSEASAAKLPTGVEAVRGDLRDARSLREAVGSARAVLYVAPHEPDEEALTDQVISACEAAGARLVFVGVHLDGRNRLSRWVQRQLYGPLAPHYRPKFRLSERVRQSACDPVVLMPTNFFQNDELFREELLAGRFPQPFAQPVNRVDVRDLGLAAARALTDRSILRGAYPVVGPVSLTGDQCAQQWSEALGREVQTETDAARVNAAIHRALSGKKRDDFLATYAVLRSFALPTRPEELARTEALLGRRPSDYASYVAQTAARWSPKLSRVA